MYVHVRHMDWPSYAIEARGAANSKSFDTRAVPSMMADRSGNTSAEPLYVSLSRTRFSKSRSEFTTVAWSAKGMTLLARCTKSRTICSSPSSNGRRSMFVPTIALARFVS